MPLDFDTAITARPKIRKPKKIKKGFFKSLSPLEPLNSRICTFCIQKKRNISNTKM